VHPCPDSDEHCVLFLPMHISLLLQSCSHHELPVPLFHWQLDCRLQTEEFWLYFQHWPPLTSHQLPQLSVTHSQPFTMQVVLVSHPEQLPETTPQNGSE
jgi:hypothetical protein